MEIIDPIAEFSEAKTAAEDARATLVTRYAELKNEMAEIKAQIGRRPRTAKAPKAPKAGRKAKAEATSVTV